MNLAVVGSRKLSEHQKAVVWETLRVLNAEMKPTRILSGGAEGVDTLARQFADSKNIPINEFFPDYKRYSRGAPLKRNDQIVDACDEILVFWDNESRGTKYTIERATKAGKPITVFHI